MKKIKEFIKKHDNIFFIILISIIISGIALDCKLVYLSDEIWNFQNIYKMYNGLQIYKDANVIITPLFFYVGEILFRIFGANFFTFRIYNILINTFLYFIVYLIFKEILNSKLKSLVYTLIVFLSCIVTVTVMSNYTSLVAALFLLGTLLNLKEKENSILNGIIIFLIFMCKQNMGVYYILALVLKIIFIDKLNKKYIINFIKQIIVFALLFIGYCCYLYINNNLYNFISYCFLGIGEFKNNFMYDTTSVCLAIFLILVILAFRYVLYKKNVNIDLRIKKIECFSIMLLLMGYPIFNGTHLGIGSILLYVEEIILFDQFFLGEIFSIKAFITFKNLLLIILMCISCVHLIVYCNYISSHKYYYKVYNGAIVSDETLKEIKQVVEFKQNNNKKTIVFGNKAAFYNIITKESYDAMDLPFIGNFGAKGEDGMIEQIKDLRNTDVLIEKSEDDVCYQESFKIRNWIKENLKLVGEIDRYYIYETE